MVNNGQPCPLATGAPFGALAKQFPELNVAPILDITGASGGPPWSQGGNFSMISSNFINTYQFGDQLSWNHGKHAFRFGFEGERILYNNTIPSSGRGELLIGSTADFLTSSAGLPGTNPLDPTYNDGTPFVGGGISFGFGLQGALTHYNRINAFDWYVQDDIKVSQKLTVNLGLRWEYDGFPDDKSGEFANVWASQAAKVNTGSFFLNNPNGTLVGFVVPSNFDVKDFGLTAPNGAAGVLVNGNKTLVPGSPLHNFAPRLGVAWQPLDDKFRCSSRLWLVLRSNLRQPAHRQPTEPAAVLGCGLWWIPRVPRGSLHNPWIAGARQPTPLVSDAAHSELGVRVHVGFTADVKPPAPDV